MRLLIVCGLSVLAGVAGMVMVLGPTTSAPAQPAPQCSQGEATTSFGTWFPPGVTVLDSNARTAPALVPEAVSTNAVGVRLQMKVVSPPGQSWSLILRDPKLRVLAILDERDFARAGAATQWTGRLESNQVSAELVGGAPGLTVTFVSGMALPKSSEGVNVFSKAGDTPQWVDPFQRTEIVYRKAAQAVGMLVTGAQSITPSGVIEKRSWCCSGAMLTSDIYITNWHCGGMRGIPEVAYWNADVCANAVLDLSWHADSTVRRQYSCEAVLHQNKRLDYVLLRVRPIIGPGAATGRAPPVTLSTALPADGNIFMIHHAECKPKLVSFQGGTCRIVSDMRRAWTDPANASSTTEITHRCDTEPGASGAPVFDSQGRMIALHHLGYEGGGPQCQSDQLNKAVKIAAILDDIRSAKPTIFAELPGQ